MQWEKDAWREATTYFMDGAEFIQDFDLNIEGWYYTFVNDEKPKPEIVINDLED